MTEMDELLPCPFCGSSNIDPEGWANSEGITGPACNECGASAGTIKGANNIAAWNRRSPSPVSVGVKALEWPNTIHRGQRVKSSGGLLSYTIAHYGGSEPQSGVVYRWAIEGGGWSEAFFAYEHAIRAAQSDYEQRILSTLNIGGTND